MKINLTTPGMSGLARQAGLDIHWDRQRVIVDGVQRCNYTPFIDTSDYDDEHDENTDRALEELKLLSHE